MDGLERIYIHSEIKDTIRGEIIKVTNGLFMRTDVREIISPIRIEITNNTINGTIREDNNRT